MMTSGPKMLIRFGLSQGQPWLPVACFLRSAEVTVIAPCVPPFLRRSVHGAHPTSQTDRPPSRLWEFLSGADSGTDSFTRQQPKVHSVPSPQQTRGSDTRRLWTPPTDAQLVLGASGFEAGPPGSGGQPGGSSHGQARSFSTPLFARAGKAPCRRSGQTPPPPAPAQRGKLRLRGIQRSPEVTRQEGSELELGFCPCLPSLHL